MTAQNARNCFLRLCGICGILFDRTNSLSSLVVERRISKLIPWTKVPGGAVLGWTLEERDSQGEYRVSVGWGTSPEAFSASSSAVTVELPKPKDRDSLASYLWPPALAGAILCRSPSVMKDVLKDKVVLEVGSGLGLTGLVAAKTAAFCQLTDNDQSVIESLQELGVSNVMASCLEWRDQERRSDMKVADVVLGTDIAYYYFLLRPLMDTVRAYMKPENSTLLIIGQANRESQWELYHNLADGCYNQLTDEKEGPWPGSTKVLLYKLEMTKWHGSEESMDEKPLIDGTVPIAAILHQTPRIDDGFLPPFSEYDYAATADDQANMMMTF